MERKEKKQENSSDISIDNSVICSDIWHKYVLKIIVLRNGSWNLRQFWNITSGIYAKYAIQIMLLLVYTTTCNAGLEITAGQRTMSGQNRALSEQIRGWPDMLSGHLGFQRKFNFETIMMEIYSILSCSQKKYYRWKQKIVTGLHGLS